MSLGRRCEQNLRWKRRRCFVTMDPTGPFPREFCKKGKFCLGSCQFLPWLKSFCFTLVVSMYVAMPSFSNSWLQDIAVYNAVESNYNKNKLSNPRLSVNLALILLHVRHKVKDMGSLTYTLTTPALRVFEAQYLTSVTFSTPTTPARGQPVRRVWRSGMPARLVS